MRKNRYDMANDMTGTTTVTLRLKLYDKHFDWLVLTKELYNKVLAFYYNVLEGKKELLMKTNHQVLRELEILTIGTREQKKRNELPPIALQGFPKLPLYFRRAAINQAISMVRSYEKRLSQWQELYEEQSGQTRKKIPGRPSPPGKFNAAPIYYKGMYRNFTENQIELKLYNGTDWNFVTYRYEARKIPEQARLLSPVIKLDHGTAFLNVPMVLPVPDIRTVKERIEAGEKLFAVTFPCQSCMAAGVVFDQGSPGRKKSFYGGRQLKAYRAQAVRRLKKSFKSRGYDELRTREVQIPHNCDAYERIENLNMYFTHQISRQIVDFCVQEKISVIVAPNYERTIPFSEKRYLKINEYEWLGRRIIRQLKYKAFIHGIVVTLIRPYHTADLCYECGSKILRYNEGHRPGKNYYGGQQFICPNGHQGITVWNTAMNTGRRFLQNYNLDEL